MYRFFCCTTGAPNGAWRAALALLESNFPAFTSYPARGYFKGAREDVMIVEVAMSDDNEFALGNFARRVAGELATILHQDTVALQYSPVSFSLVKGEVAS
jgi:hypothetical protein